MRTPARRIAAIVFPVAAIVVGVAVFHVARDTAAGCVREPVVQREAVSGVVYDTETATVFVSLWSGKLLTAGPDGRWMLRGTVPGRLIGRLNGSDELFAAGRAGVYSSTDRGATWGAESCGLIVNGFASPLVDDRVLLLAGGEGGSKAGGVAYSTDRGENWTDLENMGNREIFAVAYWDGPHPLLGAAAESGGMFVSADHGKHWEWSRVGPPLPWFAHGSQVVSTASAASGSDVWAGLARGGIYRSGDGKNWQPLGLRGLDVDQLVRTTPRVAIASGWFVNRELQAGATYRTADDGRTWRLVSALPGRWSLFALADSPAIVAWHGRTVAVSLDGGVVWRVLARVP